MTLRRTPPRPKALRGKESEIDSGNAGDRGLISVKAAVILVTAVLVGIGTAFLAHLTNRNPAAAALSGGAAFGGTILLLKSIID